MTRSHVEGTGGIGRPLTSPSSPSSSTALGRSVGGFQLPFHCPLPLPFLLSFPFALGGIG